jgi:hypothetical protein
MGNQFLVVASGIEQVIGEDSQSGGIKRTLGHLAAFVDGLSEAGDGVVVPGEDGGREGRRGVEGVAKDIS